MKRILTLVALFASLGWLAAAEPAPAPTILFYPNDADHVDFREAFNSDDLNAPIHFLHPQIIAGQFTDQDKVSLTGSQFMVGTDVPYFILFLQRSKTGALEPISMDTMLGVSQATYRSVSSSFFTAEGNFLAKLPELYEKEKNNGLLHIHTSFVLTNHLAALYYPTMMKTAEKDPIRRLMFAAIALRAGGSKSFATFGDDLTHMSQTFANYQGPQPGWVAGLGTLITWEIREVITEADFDQYWLIAMRQQSAKLKEQILQVLVGSITSRRALPRTLLEKHLAELKTIAQNDPVETAFIAYEAICLATHTHVENGPRNAAEFAPRREELVGKPSPSKEDKK